MWKNDENRKILHKFRVPARPALEATYLSAMDSRNLAPSSSTLTTPVFQPASSFSTVQNILELWFFELHRSRVQTFQTTSNYIGSSGHTLFCQRFFSQLLLHQHVCAIITGGIRPYNKTRRRLARERRGAGSSLVSMETQFYKQYMKDVL